MQIRLKVFSIVFHWQSRRIATLDIVSCGLLTQFDKCLIEVWLRLGSKCEECVQFVDTRRLLTFPDKIPLQVFLNNLLDMESDRIRIPVLVVE
jgi:hypothetical protein